MTPALLTPYLALAAPLLFLGAGLLPTALANAHPRRMARLNQGIAWLVFTCALLAMALHAFQAPRAWTLYSLELPGDVGAFSLSVYINGVTVIMLLLVSFVGVVVSRYAGNYMAGDARQGYFHKWLMLTLAFILSLIIAGNLLMFALAWIATSLSLHQLLMFYGERPAAVRAGHKKFVISRIGDVSLLLAILLIGSTLHTLEFEEIFQIAARMQGPLPANLHWAAWLIVLSAMLKSAQFPFHGWLIQVMEAPTPVSALLHAGIVNAGAFLVIRMSPVMSQSQPAMDGLALIGLLTLGLASLVMLTQTSIKVSLAWSTTAQMGFMLLECGLGLYSLAMLHLVAHSLYKAHAFLASGSGVDTFRAPPMHYTGRLRPRHWVMALGASALMTVAVGGAFGITPQQQPALLAAASIVAVAMSQLLLQAASLLDDRDFLLRALGRAAVVCVAYFSLHHLFDLAVDGSVLPLQHTGQPAHLLVVALTIAVFAVLLVIQQLYRAGRLPRREALYMHLYNGLYIDVYFTRVLQRVWPGPLAEDRVAGG